MPNENMYVAEKELCKGTLIEIEDLNDVEGIGRRRRRERQPLPPPSETVLECHNGVLARVTVTTAHMDPSAPFVAGGAELLAGLSEEHRQSVLLGEPLPGAASLSSDDFSRPTEVQSWQSRAAQPGLRAPPPSWARRRTASARYDLPPRPIAEGCAFTEAERLAAEAETDEECDAATSVPGLAVGSIEEGALMSSTRRPTAKRKISTSSKDAGLKKWERQDTHVGGLPVGLSSRVSFSLDDEDQG